jgi:hypothetical protein
VWTIRCADAELLLSPRDLLVLRDQQGDVTGILVITTSGRHDPSRLAFDQIVAEWLEHLRQHPIPLIGSCSSCADGSPRRSVMVQVMHRPRPLSTSNEPPLGRRDLKDRCFGVSDKRLLD